MQDLSAQDTNNVDTLLEQGRQLRRSLARIDREISKEQERLRRIESRLAAIARMEALAA